MNIYTYWEGQKSHYIETCLSNLSRHNVILLTPENLQQHVDLSVIDKKWSLQRLPALRSDCIRAAVIAQHGGLWLDADTVLLRDPRPVFDVNSEFSCIQHRNHIISGMFYAKKNSAFMQCWIDEINRRFKHGGYQYATYILTPLVVDRSDIDYIDSELFIPVPFEKFSTDEPLTIPEKSVAVMFMNSSIIRHGEGTMFRELMSLATNN